MKVGERPIGSTSVDTARALVSLGTATVERLHRPARSLCDLPTVSLEGAIRPSSERVGRSGQAPGAWPAAYVSLPTEAGMSSDSSAWYASSGVDTAIRRVPSAAVTTW